MSKPKFLFGDIVVINESQVGVILKTWNRQINRRFEYDIYNRMTSNIESYFEDDIERYRVRHKFLNEEELCYQNM